MLRFIACRVENISHLGLSILYFIERLHKIATNKDSYYKLYAQLTSLSLGINILYLRLLIRWT
jgi:hypothetical protein